MGKKLHPRSWTINRTVSGGPQATAGFFQSFFVSRDDWLSNFWAVGTFDSGSCKLQAAPYDAPGDSDLWRDVNLIGGDADPRLVGLSSSGLLVFGDAQIFNCWCRLSWTGVGTNGNFEVHVT